MNDILSLLFYQPIVNLLLLLYKIAFENLPIAVILITIILRLVLWPLYKKQLTAQERMKKLQPKIKAIQAQKKKSTEYTKEEKEMLAESSKAMGAGCLPTLIQLPFLFALYSTITNIIGDHADKISELAYFPFLKFPGGYHYNTHFLGLDFSNVPSKLGFNNALIIPFIILIALTVLTQWYVMKVSTANMEDKKEELKEKKAKIKTEPTPEDMQKAMNKQMMYIFPALIAFLSWNFAAILSLYWFMQNNLAIIQTLVHNKRFPLPKFMTKGVEVKKLNK